MNSLSINNRRPGLFKITCFLLFNSKHRNSRCNLSEAISCWQSIRTPYCISAYPIFIQDSIQDSSYIIPAPDPSYNLHTGKGRAAGAVTVTGAAAGVLPFFRSGSINDHRKYGKQYRYYNNICNIHILTSCSPLVYAGIQVLSNQKNILPI